jgi:NADH dehydrogenase
MQDAELNVVTGAFGYTGKHIARRLLSMGKRVRTLTGHPERDNPFGREVAAFPFNFDRPGDLADSLRGATALYNTYWVRFPRGQVTYERAIENTKTLIRAAEEAGVRRFIHISITNASPDSPLPYFSGKALLEQAVMGSKLSYAILRPTVIFGPEDILINNIAWLLRRFPLFTVPGRGDYRVQPIYVEDMAEIAVHAAGEDANMAIDAVGPETYTFDELVRLIAATVRSRAGLVHVPPRPALFLSGLLGLMLRDVVLTRDEILGLAADLLVSGSPPRGRTRLSEWLDRNASTVGAGYASELKRHYRPLTGPR